MKRAITITPDADSLRQYVKKVWLFRALIVTFAKRDLKVKYAQTYLGIAWTLLQPATGIALYTFFFGYLLDLDSGSVPFVLYVTSGLLVWNFFSYIVFQGVLSTQESAQVIKKVYFPKAVLPLSKVLVGTAELVIGFILIIPIFTWIGLLPSWRVVFLPVAFLLVCVCGLTIVFWVSAISYRLRDFIHVVPYLLYFGIWITPVFYTMELIPKILHPLMWANPMAGVVEFWRWCLFDGYPLSSRFFISGGLTFILFLGGLWLYSHNESKFSDFA